MVLIGGFVLLATLGAAAFALAAGARRRTAPSRLLLRFTAISAAVLWGGWCVGSILLLTTAPPGQSGSGLWVQRGLAAAAAAFPLALLGVWLAAHGGSARRRAKANPPRPPGGES